VTSIPRRARPSATALARFSSTWKRIVRGIGLSLPELLLEPGRTCLRLHLLRVFLRSVDVGIDRST
jgi:hypothetical protein